MADRHRVARRPLTLALAACLFATVPGFPVARAGVTPVQTVPHPFGSNSSTRLAVSGDLLAYPDSSRVIVARRTAGVWAFEESITTPKSIRWVATNGTWLAVAGSLDVWLYLRVEGAWTLQQTFGWPDSYGTTGMMVMDAGRLVLGRYEARGTGDLATQPVGVVVIYGLADGVWAETARIDPPTTDHRYFGADVALVGDRLFVSATDHAQIEVFDGAAGWARGTPISMPAGFRTASDPATFDAAEGVLLIKSRDDLRVVRETPGGWIPDEAVFPRVDTFAIGDDLVVLYRQVQRRVDDDWWRWEDLGAAFEDGGVPAAYSAVVDGGFVYILGTSTGMSAVEVYPLEPTCDGLAATIVGTVNDDDLVGTDGDDVIVGLGGNDSIDPGAGADHVCAGPGDDEVLASDGDDALGGGTGSDSLIYIGAPGGVRVHMDTGSSTGWGTDSFTGIQRVVGTEARDIVWTTPSADVVELLGGNDVVHGSLGSDRLDGGTGSNTISFRGATRDVRLDLVEGEIQLSYLSWTTITGFRHAVGGSGNDRFVGDHRRNQFKGGPGNDQFYPGAGDDDVVGGTGIDHISYAGEAGPLLVDLTADPVVLGAGIDTYRSIERFSGSDGDDLLFGGGKADWLDGGNGIDIVDGGPGNDVLIGGARGDMLVGGAGDDSLWGDFWSTQTEFDITRGTAGSDYIIPGIGDDDVHGGTLFYDDTVSFETSRTPIVVDLDTGRATGQGTDTLESIESVVGSPYGDWIGGLSDTHESGDYDYYIGLGGNDTIVMRSWHEFAGPGAGNDTVTGSGRSGSMINYSDATGGVTVTMQTGVATGHGTDTFTGIDEVVGGRFDDLLYAWDGAVMAGYDGNDKLYGSSGEDELWGDDGNDYLYGYAGDDYLLGGAGDDWGYGSTGYDRCYDVEHRSLCDYVSTLSDTRAADRGEAPIWFTRLGADVAALIEAAARFGPS